MGFRRASAHDLTLGLDSGSVWSSLNVAMPPPVGLSTLCVYLEMRSVQLPIDYSTQEKLQLSYVNLTIFSPPIDPSDSHTVVAIPVGFRVAEMQSTRSH